MTVWMERGRGEAAGVRIQKGERLAGERGVKVEDGGRDKGRRNDPQWEQSSEQIKKVRPSASSPSMEPPLVPGTPKPPAEQ